MNFDEANNELRAMQSNAGYRSQGDVDRVEYSCLEVHEILNDVECVIDGLQENYAPVIEMTKEQKDLFMHYKENTWFNLFLSKFNDPDFGKSLPDLTCFENWGYSKERENDLIRAWLHPEIIKVVE
ncbi:hypothetical protein ACT5YR_07955 [Fructobacillus fructosus]|uniref:hypothetical protein n=1 Tax=Fructobacillus fructosus TaxID=1631 RepID=UPI0040334179